MSDKDSIGIVSTGMYLPKRTLTAEEISRQSNLEECVILEKIGCIENRMAGSDDHLNQMANGAAYRETLRQLGNSEARAVDDNTYGHIGEQVNIINIIEGEKQGPLKDLLIAIAAGVGYGWGAYCIKRGNFEDKP